MRIEAHTNAWAIGDCALIVKAFDNKPSAPTGQFAERQGRQAALNLVRILKGEPTQPFRFKALGQLCSIGGYQAVRELSAGNFPASARWFSCGGVTLLNFPPWFARLRSALACCWTASFPPVSAFLIPTPTHQPL